RPPRHDVEVQVPGDAGAGGTAQVQADVEAVGAHRRLGGGDHALHQVEGVARLFWRQILDLAHVPEGGHHRVARVVGEQVHDGEAQGRAPEDEAGFVVALGGKVAEEAATDVIA